MRLIDADMLLNSFKGAKKLGVDAIKYYVDNTPTIDLVRCGECKWCKINSEYEWRDGEKSTECSLHCHSTDSNAFCSWGERRTDE